ncbi:MAG: cupin domain-containing protein [Reichenbachiella sp.]|uniref:cupin domain-containing protein n=1 Tax=Reichenbachiella sp. TaxID=2184521 RepID=UPI002966E3BC|nr:cupin domain-containing protein [Reichenbachiella sp.]MDW3210323.1 cupin domain-containing protein [Reichenbachiella sp.]
MNEVEIWQKLMNSTELEKSANHRLVDMVGYEKGSVVTKFILRKKTGTITISSFDAGQCIPVRASPFDHMIQILEGEAEIIIDEASTTLIAGEATVIPAHIWNSIRAKQAFKMLSIIIKSGYEDVSL